MSIEKNFYSKILMFGEYALICGSQALSIPYKKYFTKLVFDTDDELKIPDFNPKEHLQNFFEYLINLESNQKSLINIDINRFSDEINAGISVQSTIPLSYGLGSSGALVAAIYHRYGKNKIPRNKQLSQIQLDMLRVLFSKMETYFHGKSSGFDPLTCYLNIPILLNKDRSITQTSLPQFDSTGKGAVFLINTKEHGETRPLVNFFLKRCYEPVFLKFVTEHLIPLNNRCIHLFLNGDMMKLLPEVFKLSDYTYQKFLPMIPKNIRRIWKKGLASGDYCLKLCGSGGGGMMLGFTDDYDKIVSRLAKYDIQIVVRF